MKFSPPYKIILLGLMFVSCENKITAPDRAMNQPTGIEVSGFNRSVTVKFYGMNIEEGFTGYQVYVSRIPGMVPGSGITPVYNAYGTLPTLPYGYAGCIPDASRKSYVTVDRTSSGETVSNGAIYYVAVSAYAVIGSTAYETPYSEEKAVTVLAVGSNQLRNRNIAGMSNDGFLFTGSGAGQLFNAPDTLAAGWGGDMFFAVKSINSVLFPVLSVESNQTGLQDLGYYADLADYGTLPAAGYIYDSALILVKNHLYALKKGSQFIRIHVTDLPGNVSSLDSDVILKFKYAY